MKSFILFHRGSEAEDNWVKPTMPTDLLRPAIKFGHLDTQGKAAVLGEQQFTFVCVCVRTTYNNPHYYLCVLQLSISQVCENFMSYQIDLPAGLSAVLKQTSKAYRQPLSPLNLKL